MKVYIGCDHAGYELKSRILTSWNGGKVNLIDLGTYSEDSVDYPDFAHAVAKAVESDQGSFGILICGSANGVAITANKHKDIRCAICWTPEIAALAREHNDANIVALPGRFISAEGAIGILNAFFDSKFEGGRHQRRVDKMPCA